MLRNRTVPVKIHLSFAALFLEVSPPNIFYFNNYYFMIVLLFPSYSPFYTYYWNIGQADRDK